MVDEKTLLVSIASLCQREINVLSGRIAATLYMFFLTFRILPIPFQSIFIQLNYMYDNIIATDN